ncbi:MAG: hypothetical protein JWM47_1550 [Acidimicrobiales bacterium]|nr:hypothetical protein [Acidimicrobiales bacterium]
MTAYGQPPADPTAVMGRRIGGYAIDYLLALVVVLAVVVPAFNDKAERLPRYDTTTASICRNSDGTSTEAIATANGDTLCINRGDTSYVITNSDLQSLQLTSAGIFLAIMLLNAVLLQGLTGATIGKLLVGLRVVSLDSRVCGIGRAALRTLLLVFVDAPCCWLVGLITSLTTKGHRRVGDLAAGTVVVRKEQVGRPLVVAGLTAPELQPSVGWGSPPPMPPGAGQWGAPPGPQTWGQAPPVPAAPPTDDGPIWDEARNAYILYDRDQAEWLQWSDEHKSWRSINQT